MHTATEANASARNSENIFRIRGVGVASSSNTRTIGALSVVDPETSRRRERLNETEVGERTTYHRANSSLDHLPELRPFYRCTTRSDWLPLLRRSAAPEPALKETTISVCVPSFSIFKPGTGEVPREASEETDRIHLEKS